MSLTAPVAWLSRDRSILAFNARVLDMARRADVPLLERLRYVCIVSSNLDEFFEVRSAPLVSSMGLDGGGRKDAKMSDEVAGRTFAEVAADAHALVAEQYHIFNEQLMPALRDAGVVILNHVDRNPSQRRWVADFFAREVQPLLLPVSLDPSHPFPQVANKSLNFIAKLSGKDAFGRDNPIAIVKVPRVLPRVIRLPDALAAKGQQAFVLLTSVIRAHLHELFPGRTVEVFSQFRVTRDSELAIDEAEVDNLRKALRQTLSKRQFGNAVRLEVATTCPPELSNFLLQQFRLPPQALYAVDGPVNLVRLNQLIDTVDTTRQPSLRFPTFQPAWPPKLPQPGMGSLFDAIRRGDVLMHHPFESFDPVVAFVKEAAADESVLAIQMTIYRTGTESALMEGLAEAVRRGKEVTVVVELKARFDEEANINWADRLESIGAQVVYGVVGLKTHAKLLLVTRREIDKDRRVKLMRYAHLGTGNYNPKTARLYTDLGYFTADPRLTEDVENVLRHLASSNRMPPLHKLCTAPRHLHDKLLRDIAAVTEAARQGQPARIVAKMNALTDESLAAALVAASQAGARIDLIVRGACILPAEVPRFTPTVRIRSVIGRFLEHSRVFYFRAGRHESLWLSSADWMGRNLFRRVEVAWPVDDRKLRQRIIDEVLVPYQLDSVDAWQLGADGVYRRVAERPTGSAVAQPPYPSAQRALMARFG
jgi:polyphosphate kinase